MANTREEQISIDLFEKLRGRFDNISLGDEKANAVTNPALAKFFNFNYVDESGNNYGNITISLEKNFLKIFYGKNISSELNTGDSTKKKKEWYEFLRSIRLFSRRNMLRFDVHDIARDSLQVKDVKQMAEVNEGKLYGTLRTSYETITPNTKLCIKHNGIINDDIHGDRSRKIDSVFIVTTDGERFKCPITHLGGCRALARHISSGGAIADQFGGHIVDLIKELKAIKQFLYGSRNKTFIDPEATELVNTANDRFHEVKQIIKSLCGPRGFISYKTDWVPSTDTIVNIENLKKKFIMKNLDDRLVNGLGYVARAHQLKKPTLKGIQNEVRQFTDWVNVIMEGTSTDQENLKKLHELMKDPLLAGIDGIDAISAIQDVISDQELHNELYDAARLSPDVDVRPIIFDWLTVNLPEVAEKIEANQEIGNIPDETPEEDSPPEETSEEDDADEQEEQPTGTSENNQDDEEPVESNDEESENVEGEGEEETSSYEDEPGLFKGKQPKTPPGNESTNLISIIKRLAGI